MELIEKNKNQNLFKFQCLNLKKIGIEFFTGVPDSVLKNLTDEIPKNENHIITANEGSSIAHMIKGMPIPPNTAMKPIGKGEKIVLDATNTLYVKSDTTDSLDVILSLVEIV